MKRADNASPRTSSGRQPARKGLVLGKLLVDQRSQGEEVEIVVGNRRQAFGA